MSSSGQSIFEWIANLHGRGRRACRMRLYALAARAVDHVTATTAIRRSMPDAVAVMVLGRLVADQGGHGKRLGVDLLRDAILRTVRLAHEIGIRTRVVHALHDQARGFDLHHGFSESAIDPLVLMLRIWPNT